MTTFIKTTIRSLVKNKTYSAINLLGLVLGTVCCLYILLYVNEHRSYDTHHDAFRDIYRVTTTLELPDDKHVMASASPPIAPRMKNEFPEVKEFSRVVSTIGIEKHLLVNGEKSFYEDGLYFVDSAFFQIFSYHFVQGSPAGAVSRPYTVVLMKSIAEKLFGSENPIGKSIRIDNSYGNQAFEVTGVVDPSRGKTHIPATVFMSMNSGGIGEYVLSNDTWSGNNFAASYIKLHPESNAVSLEQKLPQFLDKYGHQQLADMGMNKHLYLQNVAEIHNTPGYSNEMTKVISSSFLKFLLLIGGLIQLIACINFMNLSTARASKRAREVGVRKVAGAGRFDLILQYLGESVLISVCSFAIAVAAIYVLLPYLNQISGAALGTDFVSQPAIWLLIFGLALLTGLLAGSYPAFFMSTFKTIKVLKGDFSNTISAAGIRRSLVVFQFVLSIALITGIIVINRQLHYIQNKDLGFNQDQQLIFTFHTQDMKEKMAAFRDELIRLPEIRAISKSNNFPSQFVFNDMNFYKAGQSMPEATDIQYMITDDQFIHVNHIKILAGRNFRQHDSTRVLVNEAVLNKLGLSLEEAPGTLLYSQRGPNPEDLISVEIAGVMQDFNYNSLHGEVRPFMLRYDPDNAANGHLLIRTQTSDYHGFLSRAADIWKDVFGAAPFEYKFMREEVQKQYESEITLSNIINFFTLIAILISCLGLFGLTVYNAEQRKKEFGIRKVIGAGILDIVRLISKEYLLLILISFLIAIPIAWWMMDKWLQSFEFKISLSWWMFFLAGVITVSIAGLTIASQAFRSASVNPVKSLKAE